MTPVCPNCASTASVYASSIRDFHVSRGNTEEFTVALCPLCRFGFSLPLFRNDELGTFYPEEYEAYNPRSGFRAILQDLKYGQDFRLLLSTHPEAKTLFELGAGRGEFLNSARKRGFEVAGLEPSAFGRRTALTHYQIDLRPGFADEIEFTQRYDAVVARHVLEHCNQPTKLLERVFKNGLNDGGILLLKLPVMGSWEEKAFGRYWCGWDLPRHRYHFDPESIRATLAAIGFEDIRVKSEFVPIDISRSFEFFLRYSKPQSLWRRFCLRAWTALPEVLRFSLSQGIALAMAPWGAGRMIVTARRVGSATKSSILKSQA